MKIFEIGTGYTSIPAKISAATELVVENLTRSMLKQKFDVNIIDIADVNRKENDLPIIEVNVPKLFTKTDVQLGILHKLKRVIYSICLTKKLKKIIKNEKEEIVLHFHNQYNLYFFLHMSSRKIKNQCLIAYTNHSGIWSLKLDDVKKVIKKRYFQESYCMKKADIVFLLNKSMHKNIVDFLNIDENKIVDIANGVDTNLYKPLSNDKIEKIKKDYNLENKKMILQIGSIYENKGQLRSIKNLKEFLINNKNVVYYFAGGIVSQEYFEQIMREVNLMGLTKQVKYLGMVSPGNDLCTLYNLASATIMSSKYEGFSLVGLESLSCGVPVLLEKDSPIFYGDGSVFYDDDIEKTIVEKIMDDKKIKDKCRKNAITNYSWDVIAKKYCENFKKYIEKGNKGV